VILPITRIASDQERRGPCTPVAGIPVLAGRRAAGGRPLLAAGRCWFAGWPSGCKPSRSDEYRLIGQKERNRPPAAFPNHHLPPAGPRGVPRHGPRGY
jgi:hypothetical protein